MKVALYHNLTSGGSKREAYELTRRLVCDGHTVHLFYPSTADETFLPLADVVHRHFSFELALLQPVRGRLPGLRKYVDLGRLGKNLGRLKTFSRAVATQIDDGAYDFVFVHHDRIVQSPYLLRYLDTRSVYYCAEPMRQFYEPPVVRPYLKPRSLTQRLQQRWYGPTYRLSQSIVKSEDRRNVHHASLLLTNSYFSAESVYRAYGLRARVVYLGVDVAKFRPLSLEKALWVGSSGRLRACRRSRLTVEGL